MIGVDEVGRGCIAGPVYAAAVCLPLQHKLVGLTDSKLLSEARREKFAAEIMASSEPGLFYALGIATVDEIEVLNILHASLLAMRRAVEALGVQPKMILVDGNQRIPGLPKEWPQECIIKGDLRAEPISAASIVAKVARDKWMVKQCEKWPQYGFSRHKGYGTAEHLFAIQKFGPVALHRRLFKGVKEHFGESFQG